MTTSDEGTEDLPVGLVGRLLIYGNGASGAAPQRDLTRTSNGDVYFAIDSEPFHLTLNLIGKGGSAK